MVGKSRSELCPSAKGTDWSWHLGDPSLRDGDIITCEKCNKFYWFRVYETELLLDYIYWSHDLAELETFKTAYEVLNR